VKRKGRKVEREIEKLENETAWEGGGRRAILTGDHMQDHGGTVCVDHGRSRVVQRPDCR
jgi:hypothetical protein